MRKKLSLLKVAHHRTQWEKRNWPKFWPTWVSLASPLAQQTFTAHPKKKMYMKNYMQKRRKNEICLFMRKKREEILNRNNPFLQHQRKFRRKLQGLVTTHLLFSLMKPWKLRN